MPGSAHPHRPATLHVRNKVSLGGNMVMRAFLGFACSIPLFEAVRPELDPQVLAETNGISQSHSAPPADDPLTSGAARGASFLVSWPIRLFWPAQYLERTRAGLSLRQHSQGEGLR